MKEIKRPCGVLFTFQDFCRLNPHFKGITLRVRLAKEIESGKVAAVATVPGGKGRPQKVFAFTPITEDILDEVISQEYNLADEYLSFAE